MIVISPAKNLNLLNEDYIINLSEPFFYEKTTKLLNIIKKLDKNEISSLMKLSNQLADLNYERFLKFNHKDNIKKPAVYMFSGDTFNGLSIRSFSKASINLAQKRLRILSGLYGLLKPMDNINPYRLEMGTNTKLLLGESLVEFWKNAVTDELNLDLKKQRSKYLFNLASKEYFGSIDCDKINAQIVNFDFKKSKNNKLINPGMVIKRYRGKMAKLIIENDIKDLDELLDLNHQEMKFRSFDSKNSSLLFIIK